MTTAGEMAGAGRSRLLRQLGAGGMGAVWLAERDDEHYQQQVAVKLIKRGMDTDEILRRFRNERQVLAQLEHPHIARLLDGGATDDDRPYLVMEYVEGKPFDRYCDDRTLSLVDRLRLFRQVCAALRYAHQNLIVHRDLKPSNMLVTTDSSVKLLDFGIAKVLSPENALASVSSPPPSSACSRCATPAPNKCAACRLQRRRTCTRSASCCTSF